MPTLTNIEKGSVTKNVLGQQPLVQVISNLLITPAPNSVSFAFKTELKSAPLIEIFKYLTSDPTSDMQPENLVTSNAVQLQGVAPKKTHQYRLPEPASYTPSSFPGFDDPLLAPLDQDSHYWFRVTANAPSNGISPEIVIGRFWTATRDAVATIEDLNVDRYGDSDVGNEVNDAANSLAGFFGQGPVFSNNYHLALAIGLYDPMQDLVDSVYNYFPSDQQSGDIPNPFPNRALVCKNANDFLWMYSFGQGNPAALTVDPGFTGTFTAPATPPAIAQSGSSQAGPWAETLGMTRLPDTSANPIQLILNTGSHGTTYDITVWFNVTVTPPRHQPVIETVRALTATTKSAITKTHKSTKKIAGTTKKS